MIIYATNRKAKHDYEFLDKFEAGIVLVGGEVKSVRGSRMSLKESYVKIKNGEIFLTQSHAPIPSFINQKHAVYEEKRDRKLLMSKKEIQRLKVKVDDKGLTLIAYRVYQPDNSPKIKVEIILAKGKKTYDKKNAIKDRDIKRDMDRTIKNY